MGRYYHIVFLLFVLAFGCKKPYEPFAVNANHRFLVVEGVINTAPGGVTTIYLSRTRNLNDSVLTSPESSAIVTIQDKNGGSHLLSNRGNGEFVSGNLNLNPALEYRLKIFAAGKDYVSDYVTPKISPPIDSITWEQPDNLFLYLDTHDPSKQTTFYRWEYIETWEYHSFFDSFIGFRADTIYLLDPADIKHKCWSNSRSTEVLIGSTAKLSEDVVSKQPLLEIIRPSIKVSVRYSILVKQYALNKEAYDYWQILKENKTQRGSLFDAQPAQLVGNIHSAADPTETVIGYISACSVEEKRLFIRNGEVRSWPIPNPVITCDVTIVSIDDAKPYLRNPDLGGAYFISGGAIAIARKQCIDCTMAGGVTVQPSFW